MSGGLRLPDGAFDKVDDGPDPAFYAAPRFVAHLDARAIGAVTALYRRVFAPGDTLLDLMSSWISHLPPEVTYGEVIGHGLNAAELAANPRLTRFFVQDLNVAADLPLATGSLDGAALCVGIQYLQRPVAVLAEIRRALRPAAPLAITFSHRCFPTKAVAIWTALRPPDQARLVSLYLGEAGFVDAEVAEILTPVGGDPLWAVTGRAPPAAP